jgi:hypothetical protein
MEVSDLTKWLRKNLKRYMFRPIIYKILAYFPTALVFVLLWNRFVNTAMYFPMSYAFTIVGLFFLALAWFNFLRLDGIKLPLRQLFSIARPPKRSLGALNDMSDYLDEEVISFAELTVEERETCRLLANTTCGVTFLVLSLL